MFNNPYMYTGNFANMYGNGMMGSALGGASRMAGGNMFGSALGGASRMAGGNMLGGALGGASRMAGGAMRGGLFGRLGGIASAIRGVNWGGFINNASKTIGVINQTIPLVKQVGPVMNNMKSMLRVASAFKDETDRSYRSKRKSYTNTNQNISHYQYSSNLKENYSQPQEKVEYSNPEDYSPTFFVQS